MMNFGQALEALKQGKRVKRGSWNRSFLLLIHPYHNDQYTVYEKPSMVGTLYSYIAIKTDDNGLIHWQPLHADMLANDWIVVDEEQQESKELKYEKVLREILAYDAYSWANDRSFIDSRIKEVLDAAGAANK